MKTRKRAKTGAALVLMVLTVAACGRLHAADAKAIQKLGGTITRDEKAENKPIVTVELIGAEITNAALKELAGLKQLQNLDLTLADVTDAGLPEGRE